MRTSKTSRQDQRGGHAAGAQANTVVAGWVCELFSTKYSFENTRGKRVLCDAKYLCGRPMCVELVSYKPIIIAMMGQTVAKPLPDCCCVRAVLSLAECVKSP